MPSPQNTLEILNKDAVGDEQSIIDCLVEIELPGVNNPGKEFLSIVETLTRVGVLPRRTEEKELFQTCHILYKYGKYYIVHFKHMFMLDGHYNGFQREDILRMNQVVRLLAGWGLYSVKTPSQMTEFADMRNIKVVKYGESKQWKLTPKYRMMYKRNHIDLK